MGAQSRADSPKGGIGHSGGEGAEEARPAVLVFGGTTEGREMAEWLSARGTCTAYVSSLTEYGGSLVQDLPNVVSLTGRMTPDRMEELMRDKGFACVVDATHPYATGVSESIAAASSTCGATVYRVLREGEPDGPWTSAASVDEAVELAARAAGPVLLTTGSKDLPAYVAAADDFKERFYVRILPVKSSIEAAAALEISPSHVIAMQGPFSQQLNTALIREFGIRTLVTKASGAAGGFWEKVQAARECDIGLIVINRPVDEEGMSVPELQRVLVAEHGL